MNRVKSFIMYSVISINKGKIMETITPVLLSGLTIALVEIIKRTEVVPYAKRVMPVVALGIGLGLAFVFNLGLLEGLMVGASAAGTYDLVKKTALGK